MEKDPRLSRQESAALIWFARENGNLYLLSGGGDSADWVWNLRKTPAVRVRIGSRDALARRLLDEKYMGWKAGKRLSSWARSALPVKIEL